MLINHKALYYGTVSDSRTGEYCYIINIDLLQLRSWVIMKCHPVVMLSSSFGSRKGTAQSSAARFQFKSGFTFNAAFHSSLMNDGQWHIIYRNTPPHHFSRTVTCQSIRINLYGPLNWSTRTLIRIDTRTGRSLKKKKRKDSIEKMSGISSGNATWPMHYFIQLIMKQITWR